jgi:hypothetical protein
MFSCHLCWLYVGLFLSPISLEFNEALWNLLDTIERFLLENLELLYLLIKNLQILQMVLYFFSKHDLDFCLLSIVGLLFLHDGYYFCFRSLLIAGFSSYFLGSSDSHKDGGISLRLVLFLGKLRQFRMNYVLFVLADSEIAVAFE